ncbi:MAG: hypothetical protein WBH57_13220 [Anaerolineae bacterium]
MAWEKRRGKEYYYRKRRIGGRVMSKYVGTGPLAEAAAAHDELTRQAQEEKRELFRRERERQHAIDEGVDRACRLIRNLVYATLLLNGYHTHKGEWRKRR